MLAFVSVYHRRRAFVEIYLRGRTNQAVHRFGREHNARVAENLRAFAVDAGLAGDRAHPEDRPLAVEVGDRVFQLAYAEDADGDPELIEEGIALVTAYLERYATPAGRIRASASDRVRERRRRRLPAGWPREGLLVGTAGNVSAREGDRVAVTGDRGRARRAARPSDVSVVSLAGERRRGRRCVPTSELDLHLDVYAATGHGRGRAHPRAVLDRGRVRPRRAAGPALPAAPARRARSGSRRTPPSARPSSPPTCARRSPAGRPR